MPYKEPERKRQWEREHRQQRNARRRMQTQAARSGGSSAPKPAHDLAYVAQQAILLARLRKPAPGPVSDEKPKSTWKTILGWAVGIGVVLLAAFASVSPRTPGDLGASPGSGHSGM